MSHTTSGNNALIMANFLERAYRLALGLEGATRKQLPKGNPNSDDFVQWVIAAELLHVLDEARTLLLKQS
ncbi:MAG: hypothetical protein ABTQ26_03355 [Azonexus sp.]